MLGIERRVIKLRTWLTHALSAPLPEPQLKLVSRTSDEVVLTLHFRPESALSAERPPSLGARRAEGVAVRIVGRQLVLHDRPGRTVAGPPTGWLRRPYVAHFALPFDSEWGGLDTSTCAEGLWIRVRRRHESTPLA
ncbi:MAG: hypothetical protein U0414_10270 [Polyangiaceae bacterium]